MRRLQCGPARLASVCATRVELRLNVPSLRLKANWNYDAFGNRQYYTLQAFVGRERVAHAHGWFETAGRFAVEKIETSPRHRSLGYGSTMVEAMRVHARECGCLEFAFQGVRRENLRAIRLYESLGARTAPGAGDLLDFVIAPP